MEKWLKENEGRDLIKTIHNFKQMFRLNDAEAYTILKNLKYV